MEIMVGFIVLICAARYYVYRCEQKRWNNGIAPCGTRWLPYDTDSQGGTGYQCEGQYTGGCDAPYGHGMWK